MTSLLRTFLSSVWVKLYNAQSLFYVFPVIVVVGFLAFFYYDYQVNKPDFIKRQACAQNEFNLFAQGKIKKLDLDKCKCAK